MLYRQNESSMVNFDNFFKRHFITSIFCCVNLPSMHNVYIYVRERFSHPTQNRWTNNFVKCASALPFFILKTFFRVVVKHPNLHVYVLLFTLYLKHLINWYWPCMFHLTKRSLKTEILYKRSCQVFTINQQVSRRAFRDQKILRNV